MFAKTIDWTNRLIVLAIVLFAPGGLMAIVDLQIRARLGLVEVPEAEEAVGGARHASWRKVHASTGFESII